MNMRNGLWMALVLGVVTVTAGLLTGCSDDDPDTGELDGYFESHPYVSDPRSGLDQIVRISPDSAAVDSIGGQVVFAASGGNPPYHWDVSNKSRGSVAGSGGASGVYTAKAVGENDVIVYDQDGNAAIGRITGEGAAAMTVAASPAELTTNKAYSVVSVTGGTPPYTWTVADNAKGNFPGSNTGSSAVYRRETSGDNVVTVTDANNDKASRVIKQPL